MGTKIRVLMRISVNYQALLLPELSKGD